jgi:hypothetical protein
MLSGSVLFGPLGCVGAQTERIIASHGALPVSAEIRRVPFYPQEQYYCGPASLAMALAWSGLSLTPDEVAQQVYTPGRQGTFAPDIVAAARRNGRLAVEVRELDDLLTELAAGHPAIVFQNLRLSVFPQWHFAVAIGYDLNERQLILRSGTTERMVMPLDAFENTWRRAEYWALVVLPPNDPPATPNPAPWLDAAAGLERSNRPQEAQLAYETFLGRWPQNRAAQMGRANALFALKPVRSRGAGLQGCRRRRSDDGGSVEQPCLCALPPRQTRGGHARGRARGGHRRHACGGLRRYAEGRFPLETIDAFCAMHYASADE